MRVEIFALALSAVLCAGTPVPNLPKSYKTSGLIELPYAGIKEPYTAWVDSANSRSRIDAYGGLTSTFYLGNVGEHGALELDAYESTDKVLNKRICLKTTGSADAPVTIQQVVPDLSTKFSFVGLEECAPKLQCMTWSYSETIGAKVNRYTFRGLSVGGVTVPYEFHFVGHDDLFGSHYDEYRVTYTQFVTVTSFPDSIFQNNVSCDSLALSDAQSHHHGIFEHLPHFRTVDHIDAAFNHFQKKHNRQYKTDREHFERAKTFRANHHFVDTMNRQNLTYTLKLNHMSDLSVNERRNMLGYRYSAKGANPPNAEIFSPSLTLAEIPTAYDWRLVGAVTPVKDQAICGSCWSFSTTGVIEGALFIKTKQLVELSQQNLMDCSWGEGNYACDGGMQFQAYEWIKKNGGIATAHSYGPYLMQDGKCHFSNATIGAKITSYVQIKEGDEAGLITALFSNPVAVSIDASHDSFGFYGSGVYYEPKCGNKPDNLDHAVLAVGYGTLDGQDYWLVKNSWSTHWGNDGYVLMSRKDNNCGVATGASFVRMED